MPASRYCLAFASVFMVIQSGIAYKSVVYKKIVYLGL